MTRPPPASAVILVNNILEPTVEYQAPSDEALTEQDPELQRLLTLGTVIEEATIPSTVFTKIGAGACGAIFARDSSSVLKLAKPSPFSLSNDYQKHKLIRNHMLVHGGHVCNLPTSVLATQRIPPLPEPTRGHLIHKFCAPHTRTEALNAPANRDCLVRVYLGSMDGRTGRSVFSLRNFPLHLNQIINLQLEVRDICTETARALAVMYWAARTDARDVEFVLGDSSAGGTSDQRDVQAMTAPQVSGTLSRRETRTVGLWLLDFNLVRDIDFENEEDHESVIQMLVSAHHANDRYYPRPCQAHPLAKTLWNVFAEAYLEMAARVLSDMPQVQMLPGRFLQALVMLERAKMEAGSE